VCDAIMCGCVHMSKTVSASIAGRRKKAEREFKAEEFFVVCHCVVKACNRSLVILGQESQDMHP
jgi:hypothetical protein